jgi:hypothetical protein
MEMWPLKLRDVHSLLARWNTLPGGREKKVVRTRAASRAAIAAPWLPMDARSIEKRDQIVRATCIAAPR